MKSFLTGLILLVILVPASFAFNTGNLLIDNLAARVDSWPGQPTQPPTNPIPPSWPGNPGTPENPGNYESAEYLFSTGRQAYLQGNFYNAIQYLRRFIDRYPYEYRVAEASYLVAEAYLRLNDFYNAISFYRKVSNEFQHYSQAHRAAYFVGYCLVKAGDYRLAIGEFRNFISRFPTSELVDDAWYVSGKTYEQLGDRANAILAYQQVVYNYSNSNYYQQALERLTFLQNGGTTYPTPPEYPPTNPIPPSYPGNGSILSDYEIYQRGHNELISGNYQNAITYFRELVRQYPSSAWADDASYWTGEAWRLQQNYPEAIRQFERMTGQYPGSELYSAAVFILAECEFANGRISAANRSYLQRAAGRFAWFQQNYPADRQAADALVRAGECYETLGEYSSAKFYYQRTIDLYPNSSAAIKAREKLSNMW